MDTGIYKRVLAIDAYINTTPNSTVLDGLAIRGNDAQNDQDNVRESVKAWISGLGY